MYFAPYIDSSGVHIPTYQDRMDALLASYQTIFGEAAALSVSSPDYQLLSLFARALDDLSQLLLADFSSRNPQYAAGTALDLLLPLAGLTRKGATFSSASLTLTGTPGAVLPSAPELLDDAGCLWRCQTAGITLDASGAALVQALCAVPGAISAPAGAIHRLVSPVAGLTSAVNLTDATPGEDAESDASCRERLFLAASAPSRSTLESLRDAVSAVPKVTSCAVYENDGDTADDRGIPAHSLCVVVSGGLNADLGPVIFRKKAPGIGTWGATSVNVEDDWGVSHTVRFQRATSVPVTLTVELTPLSGFDASVTDRIRDALTEYAASLRVGQDLVVPSLYGLCYAEDQGQPPAFSISLLTASARGVSTGGVLAAEWNLRYTIPSSMIHITVAG